MMDVGNGPQCVSDECDMWAELYEKRSRMRDVGNLLGWGQVFRNYTPLQIEAIEAIIRGGVGQFENPGQGDLFNGQA
jgi:hypothetical protein